ncbi:Flagellar FliJ protein [Planctomycetes bacterium Pla163]|uniref:Flagellar FliJ protein n=1 Tax=Rohdeia mirabilis TaxID=2528008 RepID=A0A518D4V0_9BACT|nr:Flagellar FliJ protein [Planctomycetes bacterium Pla163]
MSAKRFRFRLERVARLRELTEREALAEMGRERQRAAEAEQVAVAAHSAAHAALDQLATAPDPAARITGDRFAARLAQYAALQRAAAETAREDAERAAATWRERRIESQAVERLRQRAFERFLAEAETADERERDEVAMQRRIERGAA